MIIHISFNDLEGVLGAASPTSGARSQKSSGHAGTQKSTGSLLLSLPLDVQSAIYSFCMWHFKPNKKWEACNTVNIIFFPTASPERCWLGATRVCVDWYITYMVLLWTIKNRLKQRSSRSRWSRYHKGSNTLAEKSIDNDNFETAVFAPAAPGAVGMCGSLRHCSHGLLELFWTNTAVICRFPCPPLSNASSLQGF